MAVGIVEVLFDGVAKTMKNLDCIDDTDCECDDCEEEGYDFDCGIVYGGCLCFGFVFDPGIDYKVKLRKNNKFQLVTASEN